MKRKRIPIGKSDFKDIIEDDYYYIDKTGFIEEILEKKVEVTLITRPRRFGKTLNMSTLKYFFDIKNSEKNRELFNGLYIEKTKWIEEQGKYPVIFMTMKDIKGENYKEFLISFRRKVSKLFREHKDLRKELDERDLEQFDKIWFGKEDGDYEGAIQFLAELYLDYRDQKPILLIDEYDSPMIKADEKGYYEDVKELISEFYGSALKDGICSFSVVTGILKVAKESVFSSLNNLDVSTILTEGYEFFGMREKEVEDILKYYGWETTLEDTKKWYNGYLFGTTRVYNPWSILKHCQYGKLEPFWINTSTNELIKKILREADREIFEVLFSIVKEGNVVTSLQENMFFGDMTTDETLLYLMFSAGYLTIEKEVGVGNEYNEKKYMLKIPNVEVKSYFAKTFKEIVTPKTSGNFDKLIKALKDGDITGDYDSLEGVIQRMFQANMSFMDGDRSEEKFYHNLILGIMMLMDREYHVFSNRESGYGRYDLALEPVNKKQIGYIFEFKVADNVEEMDKLGSEALSQIEKKLYDSEMRIRRVSKITKIGMVFYGKQVRLYIN